MDNIFKNSITSKYSTLTRTERRTDTSYRQATPLAIKLPKNAKVLFIIKGYFANF